MIYIIYDRQRYFKWHTGTAINPRVDALHVTSVQADCQGLAYIKQHFTNLPIVDNKHTQCWFGDHAKFIAANLPDKHDIERMAREAHNLKGDI